MRVKRRVTGVVIALLVSGAQAADKGLVPVAQEKPTPPPITEKRWQFVAAPYLLAPNIDGSTRIGRLPSTDLNVSPGTIFDNLNFGAMAHFEALYNNRFGAVLDIAYMDLGSERTFPAAGGSVSAGYKQLVNEGFLGYRFYQAPRAWAEAYAGARLWYNELDVTAAVPGNAFSARTDETWIDPVIGLRGQLFLNDKWSLYSSGNIGGFGLRYSADFTWAAQAGVGYHLSETMSLQVQYKALSVDYDNDKSGSGSFRYDTVTHGPLAGLAFRF